MSADLFRKYVDIINENSVPVPDDKETLTINKLEKMAPSLAQLEKTNPEHPAVVYAASRNLTPFVKQNMFVADNLKSWVNDKLTRYMNVPVLQAEGAYLLMPYFDKTGIVTAIKCRAVDPDAKSRYLELNLIPSTQRKPKIFGLARIDPKKKIYVLEGEIDSAFIPNGIGMSGGGDITLNLKYLPYPKQQYTIVYDNELDKPTTVSKMVQSILNHYKVCIWPKEMEKYNDVNDMVNAGYTVADLVKIINNNTFAGSTAIDVLKQRKASLKVPNSGDIWTKVTEEQVDEYTSKQEQTTKPIPELDKFLTDLYPLKSSLNPEFWTSAGELKPKIQKAMLMWAEKFISEMRINKARVVDIQFKGSLANYVYHDASDIDVHIIVDREPPNAEMAGILEKQRKYFNDTNNYTIFGYPVEFFIKVDGAVHSSDAVYSVLKGDWIRKPNPVKNKEIDSIKEYFVPWYNSILEAYNSTLSKTKDKERALNAALKAFAVAQDKRNTVLDGSPGAEYKPENLAFKAIKRTKLFLFLQTEKRRFDLEKQTLDR
jgi:hypothetical protein